MNNIILQNFHKDLDLDYATNYFKDICCYSMLQGFNLFFSATKDKYVGHFSKNNDELIMANTFSFINLDQVLFNNCLNFKNYIIENKCLVKIYFLKNNCCKEKYYLEILKPINNSYDWETYIKVSSKNLEELFINIDRNLISDDKKLLKSKFKIVK